LDGFTDLNEFEEDENVIEHTQFFPIFLKLLDQTFHYCGMAAGVDGGQSKAGNVRMRFQRDCTVGVLL
jgi:hypothetical protein